MNASRRLWPPAIGMIAIAAMVALHLVVPVAPAPLRYAGAFLFVAGAAFVVWSRRAFQGAGTPIKPFLRSTALLRHGLYRWSRNPIYLGGVMIVAGVAIVLGSLTPWLAVATFFAILQEGFVRNEERLLEEIFGDEYREYRRAVRHWI